MQVVKRLDIIIRQALLTTVFILELQNLRLFPVIHNLTKQILDRVASIVKFWQFKHGNDTCYLVWIVLFVSVTLTSTSS